MTGVDAGRLGEAGSAAARLRDRLRRWALGIAIRLAEAAGIERTLRFGSGLGRAWYGLRLPRTRRVREQLAAAFPELDREARARWERGVFAHLALGLAELLLLSGRHRAELLSRMRVVGLEHLERAARDSGGKGAVVIGPHLGNWELAAARLASLGVPVATVYRSRGAPALEEALRRVRAGPVVESATSMRGGGGRADRGEPGAQAEPIEQIALGPRAGVQLVRALDAGRHVLVLLDQHAHRDEGRVVEFFGRPARTRFGPLKLADRVGASVLFAYARREPDGRHHTLTLSPLPAIEAGANTDEAVLLRNLQTLTRAIEDAIRTAPDQWIWTHRRWRGSRSPSAGG